MKEFVLDTNILISDSDSIDKYSLKGRVVIPFITLKELDKLKTFKGYVGASARRAIRKLEKIRTEGSERVILEKNPSIFAPAGSSPDELIILTCQNRKTLSDDVTLVSNDINLRVRADGANIKSTQHFEEDEKQKTEDLFLGHRVVQMPDILIDSFYRNESIYSDDVELETPLNPNEYLTLQSSTDPKKTALARFISKDVPFISVSSEFPELDIFKINPRNREQVFALDLLLNPNIPLVTLAGISGVGKSLLATAAGLAQVGMSSRRRQKGRPTIGLYNRMIVSRPVVPLGRDIGFLPGDLTEKMLPWLQPVQDNLDFLLGSNPFELSRMFDDQTIQMEAMTYIRGRSISDSYLYFDEIQNSTKHEIKTVITRVGEGSKIVMTGDIEQIDNETLNETNNALSYVVEKFKDSPLHGHISLTKGERSKLATEAAKRL